MQGEYAVYAMIALMFVLLLADVILNHKFDKNTSERDSHNRLMKEIKKYGDDQYQ